MTLKNVHPETACKGRGCSVHHPSDHHMWDWPKSWHGGWYERTCPHGIGHTDPDDLVFHESQGRDWVGVHDCDGCCQDGES